MTAARASLLAGVREHLASPAQLSGSCTSLPPARQPDRRRDAAGAAGATDQGAGDLDTNSGHPGVDRCQGCLPRSEALGVSPAAPGTVTAAVAPSVLRAR